MRHPVSLPARTGLVAVAALTVGTGLLAAPAAHAESDPIKVTQSYSDEILPLNGLACSDNVNVSDNSFLRRFDLSDYDATDGFDVSSVSVGIEEVINAPTGAVSIYAIDSTDDFVFANLEPVDSEPVSYTADQNGTVLTVPLTGTIPAGKDLVIEMTTDQASNGSLFYPGTNAAGETAPGYIASADCGLNEPATFGEIGFNDIDLVMYAHGKSGECLAAEDAAAAAPAAVDAAQADFDAAEAVRTDALSDLRAAQRDVSDARAAKKAAVKDVRAAQRKHAAAIKTYGFGSRQVKAAAAAVDRAKSALVRANTVLARAKDEVEPAKATLADAKADSDAAADALDAAQADLDEANATETAECAQPELPTAPTRPSTGAKVSQPAKGFGFHTAAR